MSNKTEIRYLSPVDIEKRKQSKYLRHFLTLMLFVVTIYLDLEQGA